MIITGYADNDALAGRLKDVVILSKPFTLENLATAIGLSMLSRKQVAEPAGSKR